VVLDGAGADESPSASAVALAAGGVIVAVATAGVPSGVSGVPLTIPGGLTLALVAGIVVLGLVATTVAARLALRASSIEAMRAAD
jgi:hypothetical protein